MAINYQDYYPGQWSFDQNDRSRKNKKPKRGGVSIGVFVSVICVMIALTVLLTYTLTSALKRAEYSEKLLRQQEKIEQLQTDLKDQYSDFDMSALDVLAALFENYSYYANDLNEEELINAVLKAYTVATGDRYATYYTQEEYAALLTENTGDHVGIGVSVIQSEITVSNQKHTVMEIILIFENGSAAKTELRVGDCIYSIKVDGEYKTINDMTYEQAMNAMLGEAGTMAEFKVYRPNGAGYDSVPFSVPRASFESMSVTYELCEQDPTVGIVQISEFDLTTPKQFKKAVMSLQESGVSHFVFDVRNNPGGDLQSIKAVLTYFLQRDDLILKSIDRNGKDYRSYYADPILFTDEYAACNVSDSEIGMFADLDMVVLCNENTASAAEVFTATLRDYGLAKIVGVKTFGKGIMQTFFPLSSFGDYSGYIKMTTYAYVTACGITYHDIGIMPEPEYTVELSEEAKQYHFYVLPQSVDNQLQAAIAVFS